MKRRSTKNILLIFIAILFLVSITGYFLWNKPHEDIKEAIAIEIDAIALYNIFITDSIYAKTTYVNKVLNVAGIVKMVAVNQGNQQIILLKTSEPDASVNCTMEGSAVKCKVGDHVLLKGLCVGYIGRDADMGLPGDVFLIRFYSST